MPACNVWRMVLLSVLSIAFVLNVQGPVSSAQRQRAQAEWIVFTIPESGEVMRALYVHPNPGKRLPVIVYHHSKIIEKLDYEGGKEQGYDVADFVKALADHDYVALAPIRSATTGDDIGLINQGVMAFLKDKSDVAMDRVAMIGYSNGSAIALEAAATMPQLKAAVLLSPALDKNFIEGHLEKIQVPTLVLRGKGEGDGVVTGTQRSLVGTLQQQIENVQLKTHYPGDQTWFQKVREEYWPDLIHFLDATMTATAPQPGTGPQPMSDEEIAKNINRSIAPKTSGVGGQAMVLRDRGVDAQESLANLIHPGQAVRVIKNVVGRWEITVERNFENYQFRLWDQAPTHLQVQWEQEHRRIDEKAGNRIYGEEFFALFLEYHRVKMLAALKYLRNDHEGAKDFLRKAQAMTPRLKELARHPSMPPRLWNEMAIQATLYIGVIEVTQGNADVGRKRMQDAFDQAKDLAWKRGMAQAAYYMAQAAEKVNAPDAQTYFDQALEVAKTNEVMFFLWQSYFNLGFRAFTRQNYDEAVRQLQQCIQTIEVMRTTVLHHMDHFMGDKQHVFFTLLDALWNKGDAAVAFEVADNAKSRALADLLRSRQAKNVADIKPALLRQEQQLLEQIEGLEVQADEVADEKIVQLKARYAKVLDAIKAANPRYASLKTVRSTQLQDVQKILDEKTVLIEFYLAPAFVLAWLVTDKSIRMERMDIPGPDIADKVQAVHMLIRKPNQPAVYKLLAQLHEILISRFDADLTGKNIIFVPDASLSYLPFAALMDKEGKFLMERHAIASVPSANILSYSIGRRGGPKKTLVVLGNPDLGEAKMDLPFAQSEAENIAKQFPGTSLFLRKEATETAAKKHMGNFDIVHFACHGEMNAQEPMQSCLRLAGDGANDGKLEAGEIFEMALKAQLVVLSGCETGIGTFIMGNEILGLIRSFFYAGTPAVIASFWKVDDNATSLLMNTFYESLPQEGKAEALRRAQLKTMQAKKHPYYWASFYLSGDGS